jgi:hypothetical protein
MSLPSKWERSIYHIGEDVEPFFRDYFSSDSRKILLIGGAGFDPRSTVIATLLAEIACNRSEGFFLREERPNPDQLLVKKAEENEAVLRQLLTDSDFKKLEIFAADDAVVGGRTAVTLVNEIDLSSFSDIIVDLSALSIGVAFPVSRFLFEQAQRTGQNLHLVVVDEPATDVQIKATSSDSPTTVHGFKGGWELDEHSNASKLWMPQLSLTKKGILDRIHSRVAPHAVCPILPFPSTVPRLADTLIEHYGDLLQNPWQIDARDRDLLQNTWHVDARDIVYASERSPVDLYRTILRIDDARKRVFAETGGSQIILSPIGSKALAIGALMAALERDFTVMYIESLNYSVDFVQVKEVREREKAQLVHVWLHGDAYATAAKEAPQK